MARHSIFFIAAATLVTTAVIAAASQPFAMAQTAENSAQQKALSKLSEVLRNLSKPAPAGSAFPYELEAIERAARRAPARGSMAQAAARDLEAEPSDWIFLIIYRPTISYDFSSPSALYTSLIWENFDKIGSLKTGDVTIGHTQVAWSCKAEHGFRAERPEVRGATGHTGDRQAHSVKMIEEGGGMTPLFYDYVDGILETPKVVNERLSRESKTAALIAVRVRPDDCRQTAAFFGRFATSGAASHFSLTADPERFEGGVCWSTAMAATKHVKAIRAFYDLYVKAAMIPEAFLGQPRFVYREAVAPQELSAIAFQKNLRLGDFALRSRWLEHGELGLRFQYFDFPQFARDFENGFTDPNAKPPVISPAIGRATLRSTTGKAIQTLFVDGRD